MQPYLFLFFFSFPKDITWLLRDAHINRERKKGGVSPDGHGQKKNRRVEEFQGQSTKKNRKMKNNNFICQEKKSNFPTFSLSLKNLHI
jgi:hypothetical protein